jgi:aryl-alcohol dehydrogenase-like predicted oxidoreductase
MPVETRTFGRTALRASAVGLGTWPIGAARYGASDDRDARRAIAAALDCGITCFDTAPSYGNGHAEELLGQALGSRRAEAVIVTKGGLVWDEGSHVLGRDSRRAALERHLDGSLGRLRTDYVDLYLIHWPDPAVPFDEVAQTLASFVQSGRVRQVGVSNFTGAQLRACARALGPVPLAADQVSFSLFDGRWARDVFGPCEELGVGVMAYGPLAHGLLTGAFTRATVFDESDWRRSGTLFGQALLTPGNFERNLDVVERLGEIARGEGLTLPQLALAWVLDHRPVTVALVGARTPEEIRDAAGAGGARLREDVRRRIDEAMRSATGLSTVLPT